MPANDVSIASLSPISCRADMSRRTGLEAEAINHLTDSVQPPAMRAILVQRLTRELVPSVAISRLLAESISRFTQDLDQSKEIFLAILGHDLRTPLGAVMMSAEFMLEGSPQLVRLAFQLECVALELLGEVGNPLCILGDR